MMDADVLTSSFQQEYGKQLLVMPTSQDFLLMGLHATLEVHITRSIAPVEKEEVLIVRTGESDYLTSVCGPIQKRTAT